MIIDKIIKNHIPREKHEKNSFWCSEAETPVFDIYHKWMGTEVSNGFDEQREIIFSAGTAIEEALVARLVKKGICTPLEDQTRVEMEREGIKITGYIDAILTDGSPMEIKTFYGFYQLKELKAGNPKTSYLKQLAMYMDFLDQEKGYLFYMERGTGEMFEFELVKQQTLTGRVYKCNEIEFDLNDVYKRWARLYKNNIVPKIEPKSEFRYKIPVDEVDWDSLSNADITKARTGKKVIGDSWHVQYSSYKNLIIQREADALGKPFSEQIGYTDEEISTIKEITKGFTAKK